MYIRDSQSATHSLDWAVWLKRLGWLGLLFFAIKGVVWLTLPLLLVFIGVGV